MTLLVCVCGHPAGDHQPAGTRHPHPPRYGLCLIDGCGCREFHLNDVKGATTMTGLTWENAQAANGPRLVEWLDTERVPVPSHPGNDWRNGRQATIDSIDRLLTRHGLHLWMVPDEVWEPRKPRRPRVDDKARVNVLAAYDKLGSKRRAARAARVPVSTARAIIDRERNAA